MAGHEFGSPHAMQEAVRTAQDSVLEVGVGRFLPTTRDNNVVRVGLNIDPRQHALLCEEIGKAGPNSFAAYFDLRELADADPETIESRRKYFEALFGDIRFTSLRFTNVFGEHNTKEQFRNDARINPTGKDYLGSSTNEQKLASVRLATGLLAVGGELVIKEFVTPSQGFAPELLANPAMLEEFGYKDVVATLSQGSSIHDDSPPFEIHATKI